MKAFNGFLMCTRFVGTPVPLFSVVISRRYCANVAALIVSPGDEIEAEVDCVALEGELALPVVCGEPGEQHWSSDEAAAESGEPPLPADPMRMSFREGECLSPAPLSELEDRLLVHLFDDPASTRYREALESAP